MPIKSIQIEILHRQYPLRVDEESEALMRELASYVNKKMTAFRDAYRDQSEVTTAVITSLAIAEELYTARRKHDKGLDFVEKEVKHLANLLARSLEDEQA